jgi:hypothetical protein
VGCCLPLYASSRCPEADSDKEKCARLTSISEDVPDDQASPFVRYGVKLICSSKTFV